MSNQQNRLVALLTFTAAVLVPLLIFMLGYHRVLHIAMLFAQEELAYHAPVVLALALIVVATIILRRVVARYGVIVLPLSEVVRGAVTRFFVGIMLVALAILAYEYMALRCRMFSEIRYPQRALSYLRRNDFTNARLTCEEYLQLYPQRRRGSRLADHVCVPLLDFTTAAAKLYATIEAAPPRFARMDQMALRVDWPLRRDSLALLKTLSAGDVALPASSNPTPSAATRTPTVP